jgi:hypothetical protein
MSIINSLINGTTCYKVLITDIDSHIPSVDEKYFVKLDETSGSGFSGKFAISDVSEIQDYFTGWVVSPTVDSENYAYIRFALPPRILTIIEVDQVDAEINITTQTGL